MKHRCLVFCTLALLAFLLTACGETPPLIQDGTGSSAVSQTPETPVPETTGGNEPSEEPQSRPSIQRLNFETPGIRLLGVRSLASDQQINIDWSCSGIEFTVDGQGGEIRFQMTLTADCYYRAYVDGDPWLASDGSPYYLVSSNIGVLTLREVPAGRHTIRVMKVTGYTLARSAEAAVCSMSEQCLHMSSYLPCDTLRPPLR